MTTTNPDLDELERLVDSGELCLNETWTARVRYLLAQARRAAELSVRVHQERLGGYQAGWDEAVKAWRPETARLERENGELRARITTICDEACGLQPVQPADESMTLIEQELESRARECWRLERENGELRERHDQLRAAVMMYIDMHGLQHRYDCPEDDTCECALVRGISKALEPGR